MTQEQRCAELCRQLVGNLSATPGWPLCSFTRATLLAIEVRRIVYPGAKSVERRQTLIDRIRPIASKTIREHEDFLRRLAAAARVASEVLETRGVAPVPARIAALLFKLLYPEFALPSYPIRRSQREAKMREIVRDMIVAKSVNTAAA